LPLWRQRCIKMKALLVYLGLILSAQPCFGADRSEFIGVWKLKSFEAEFKDGRSRPIRAHTEWMASSGPLRSMWLGTLPGGARSKFDISRF
jgi:hypothetical protein